MDDSYDINMEAYFAGTMSSAELRDFEIALKANPELRQRLDEFLAIKKASASIMKDRLRAEIDGIDLDSVKTTTETQLISNSKNSASAKIIRFVKPLLTLAAMFVLGIFAYKNLTQVDTAKLFAQNFERYTPQQSRGEISTTEIDIKTIDKNEINTPELKLLFSTLKIEQNENEEAIEVLTSISDNTAFRDQKYWYIALAQLKLNKVKEAKETFNKLQSFSNYKKQEIKNILTSLE